MKVLAIALFLACLFAVPVQADLNPASPNMFFALTQADQEWLQYYYLSNPFDSAIVKYHFGEVRLLADGESTRVNLQKWNAPKFEMQGAPGQGENSDLLTYGTTQAFTVPQENGQVEYFRRLQAVGRCIPEIPPNGGGNGGSAQEWDILDRTEFVIQVVRESDGAILGSIDSAGMFPHTIPFENLRYGTDPGSVLHLRALPAAAAGETVFLRISARRYGPSPFGLVISQERQMWNMSAAVNAAGNLVERVDGNVFDFYSAAIFSYCDSVKAATGWLPDYTVFHFSEESGAEFDSRYFTAHVNDDGVTYYKEIPPSNPKQAANRPSFGHVVTKTLSPAILGGIAPNPAHSQVTVTVKAYLEIHAVLELHNTAGHTLGQVWKGTLNKGENALSVDVSALNLANGTYVLKLEEASGEVLDVGKIAVSK